MAFSGFLKLKLEQMNCLEHPGEEKKKGALRGREQLHSPSKFSPPQTGEVNPAPSGTDPTTPNKSVFSPHTLALETTLCLFSVPSSAIPRMFCSELKCQGGRAVFLNPSVPCGGPNNGCVKILNVPEVPDWQIPRVARM